MAIIFSPSLMKENNKGKIKYSYFLEIELVKEKTLFKFQLYSLREINDYIFLT